MSSKIAFNKKWKHQYEYKNIDDFYVECLACKSRSKSWTCNLGKVNNDKNLNNEKWKRWRCVDTVECLKSRKSNKRICFAKT